jgi:hypothetical protein
VSKALDTLSKILAQAENAGTPEEAATFMEKAQAMSTGLGIDLAVARMHQAKKERVQIPEERKIQVNPFNRRHNRKHFTELAMAICDVNDVEYLITDYSLHCVGFPSDLDVVEALYAHLAAQMVIECDEALAAGANREVRQVLVTEKVEIPWDEREWQQWNGRQYYDDNPDDEVYCRQWDEEPDEDFARREAEAIAKERAWYLDAVKNGDRIYCSQARGEGGEWGGYRRPVPPPATVDVPVLDDDGKRQYEEREIAVVDGRVFRNSFYAAFVPRMRGRLWEARKAAEREHGMAQDDTTSEMALAVRDKKKEVADAHKVQREQVAHLGVYEGSDTDNRKTDHTGTGRVAGARAAETVPVDEGRAVK